jgi:Nitrile hydratase beta subunit
MSAADVATASKATERFDRPYAGEPRFAAGDRVRAVLRVQPGHTRLPRYVRGHVGMVVAVHGAHVVPDENAQGYRRASLIRSLLGWPSYFPSGQTPPTKFISTCGSGTLSGSNRLEPLADELRPAFNEPWQAEAYALVQVLNRDGSDFLVAMGKGVWRGATGGCPRRAGQQRHLLRRAVRDPTARPGSWRARAGRRDSTADRRLASCLSPHTSRQPRETQGSARPITRRAYRRRFEAPSGIVATFRQRDR